MARTLQGTQSGMDIRFDEAIGYLKGAKQVYVAVPSRSGPHITPELFAVGGSRILCLTAATALKVAMLRQRPLAGIAARTGEVSLIGMATAEILDPLAPLTMLRDPALAVRAPAAVARFVRENAAELSGAALDLVTGQLGFPVPPRRVLLALTPVALAAHGNGPVRMWGDWRATPVDAPGVEHGSESDDDPDFTRVPDHIAALAVSGPTMVGWTNSSGWPIVLPGEWDADRSAAHVAPPLFELASALPESPACLTFDGWTGYGPSGKQGVMLRGAGRASNSGERIDLHIDLEQATYWDGVERGTASLAVPGIPGTDAPVERR